MINYEFDVIIAISRGGLLPALLLSHKYNCKNIQIISMESYVNNQQSKLKLINNNLNILNKKVLIVDDLVDTGNTLAKSVKLCKDAIEIKTYVWLYKEGSKIIPDFYEKKINDEWINFKYETDFDYKNYI